MSFFFKASFNEHSCQTVASPARPFAPIFTYQKLYSASTKANNIMLTEDSVDSLATLRDDFLLRLEALKDRVTADTSRSFGNLVASRI